MYDWPAAWLCLWTRVGGVADLPQSWSPSVPSRAFGMLLPGKAALAVRILTLLHFVFSTAMFIGWFVLGASVS